jgi:hypothetical protein
MLKLKMTDSYYSNKYSKKSLEQLKDILKDFEPYVSYTDQNGRRTTENRSNEHKWLEKRVSQLENLPKTAENGETDDLENETEFKSLGNKGGKNRRKTRKHRKGSKKAKKTSKRTHRK